jgi:NAD(P)-dependent dehydrogenase (short-subunit alcohol dehydrogenase family)
MVCRNKERGEDARQKIIESSKNPDIHLLIGDVSMKQDVKKMAEDFMAQEKELNVLILNAGALCYKKEVNAEGLETTIAAQLINGAYYLTKLLIPVLKNDSRVIAVSSGGMYNVAFPDWYNYVH